jgi:hypothetical protein
LKNFHEKMKEFKILFCSFNQTYASLLAKDCFTKLLYLLRVVISNYDWEWLSIIILSNNILLFQRIIS